MAYDGLCNADELTGVAMKEFARPLKDEYWSWWTARGPLRCSELRTRYEGSVEFMRMTQRAVAKVEDLIRAAR